MKTFLHKWLKFTRAEDGLAYLEFAICLPFILALLLGAIEVTRYILIVQKVEKAAVTISDLVAQGDSISAIQLDDIIKAAEQVMLPYSFGADGYVIISSVTQSGNYSVSNQPRVNWQYTGGGTWAQPSQIGTPGNPALLPTGMTLNDKDNVIVAEVYYNYQPLLATNHVITGATIYKSAIFKPRLGALSTLSFLMPYSFFYEGAVL